MRSSSEDEPLALQLFLMVQLGKAALGAGR
jgi:hypothetical protein